jgi:hypothetical protein
MGTMIGNDRLYKAVQALMLGEGDIKNRVVSACYSLKDINRNEQYMSPFIYNNIQKILNKAGRSGPLVINGCVVRGSFEHTARNKRRSTYSVMAKEIYDLYIHDLGLRGFVK